ncbi:Anaerobic nitric oxide reductase transcription regulator NorR [subsurface metagenome]
MDVYDNLTGSLWVPLTVGNVMSKDVITICSDETVASAAKIMSENSVSCIVVADNGDVTGILTETDFLKRVAEREKDFDRIKVREIMSAPVESISPNLSVPDAVKIMEDKHIKRLPILEKKRLVGIVTQTDLVRVVTFYGRWKDVEEIMSRDVAGIQSKATIVEAAEVMTRRSISCIVVLEGDEVVGVVTERDLLERVVALQKDPGQIKMEEVMSSPVTTVSPDYSVFSSSRIMEKMGIRRLVITEDKRPCGIISQTDILRATKKKLQMETAELSDLRRRLKTEQSFAGIVGRDAKMLELFDTIREVAEVNIPVLIQGESGTGKELVAAAIHNEGHGTDKPFVPVNCGALPEGILESELFGHVKGAFTGAIQDRKGRFELADGGTIFLDEIGDIPAAMQVKLLRVLEEGTLTRVGGEESIKVDVRVISATNKNLAEEVAAGRFREDLFYRLCVVPVYLPPLRERRNDIPLLAERLLKKALTEVGREDVVLSPETVGVMMDYEWPGNVRELENALRYALVKCRDNLLLPEYLPLKILETYVPSQAYPRKQRKRKLDAESVWRTLEETSGNKVEAAVRLGVSRATLYRFLQESKITSK